MKKILCLVLVVVTLTLSLTSCFFRSIKNAIDDVAMEIYQVFKPKIEKEHTALIDIIRSQRDNPSYDELFAYCDDYFSHIRKHYDCEMAKENNAYQLDFFSRMLSGTWKDSSGNCITMFKEYSDYNNTRSDGYRFRHNLKSSTSTGNSYYLYFDVRDNNLIIGYKNKATGQRIDNFKISFYSDHILLFNYNDNNTYTLFKEENNNGIYKGNSKYAYDWITHLIDTDYLQTSTDYFDLSTFEIVQCDSDKRGEYVFVVFSWENASGATIQKKYKLHVENGVEKITELSYTEITDNIDLEELNKMIRKYIDSKNK